MEFSCAAESETEGTPADDIKSKQTKIPASTATICYVPAFFNSYPSVFAILRSARLLDSILSFRVK
jgi:hypothetical protein